MKSLVAFGSLAILGILSAAPAAAQFGARSGALGGNFASRGMSRPLGGIAPGFTGLGVNRNFPNRNFVNPRRPMLGFPYAYSVWVPDYFDYLNSQNDYGPSYYAPPYGAPPAASAYYAPQPGAAPPQPPVIINQYFGAKDIGAKDSKEVDGPSAESNNTPGSGDLIGNPQNYYLIAYKNHAIYAALAYWVEDRTLHYVTTENTHNQASLDLIDVTLSKSLNQGRAVPFSIAGQ